MGKFYVRLIDTNGFFIEDAFVEELTKFTVETPCPSGLYWPKWVGTFDETTHTWSTDSVWVDGKTAEEIAAITGVTQAPSLEKQVADLSAAVTALMGV